MARFSEGYLSIDQNYFSFQPFRLCAGKRGRFADYGTWRDAGIVVLSISACCRRPFTGDDVNDARFCVTRWLTTGNFGSAIRHCRIGATVTRLDRRPCSVLSFFAVICRHTDVRLLAFLTDAEFVNAVSGYELSVSPVAMATGGLCKLIIGRRLSPDENSAFEHLRRDARTDYFDNGFLSR